MEASSSYIVNSDTELKEKFLAKKKKKEMLTVVENSFSLKSLCINPLLPHPHFIIANMLLE